MVAIVIPLFNEDATIGDLYYAVVDILKSIPRDAAVPHEVIFVDDGSTDESWKTIELLCRAPKTDPRIVTRGIRFRRNFGKAAALSAGFETARNDIVITMDADLQDNPKEIPRFMERLQSGFDVVSGWKRIRHDPWHKTLPSKIFNWLVSRMTGVHLHDHNCGFKAYRREIFDQVKLYGELHRFVPVLANAYGWRVSEIEVEHQARKHGVSKYGVSRLFKGFLDLLTVKFLTHFAYRPLHLIGSIGLASFVIGLLGIGVLSVLWVASRIPGNPENYFHLHGKASFYLFITAILLGAQFLVAGLLSELIASIARRDRSPALVADFVESPAMIPADTPARTIGSQQV